MKRDYTHRKLGHQEDCVTLPKSAFVGGDDSTRADKNRLMIPRERMGIGEEGVKCRQVSSNSFLQTLTPLMTRFKPNAHGGYAWNARGALDNAPTGQRLQKKGFHFTWREATHPRTRHTYKSIDNSFHECYCRPGFSLSTNLIAGDFVNSGVSYVDFVDNNYFQETQDSSSGQGQ